MRYLFRFLPVFLLLMTDPALARTGWVEVGEGRLYYEEHGEGVPLIFVHGHSLDRRMWREQVKAFKKHYRVIVYDARGYGRSSKQSEGMRFTHCDDLVALMDALDIDEAHVVGLSMGGFIAGDLLAVYPERLLSVVMAEGMTRSTPSVNEPMMAEERATKQASIDRISDQGLDAYKEQWIGQLLQGGSRVGRIEKPLRKMIYDWDGWQAVHHEPHCYYAREALRVTAERRPEVPTLIIRAQRPDGKRPSPPSLMDHLPNSRFEVIEDSGHMCNMEQPEVFNQMVLDFLCEYQ